jgi:hypothetical protein
VVGVVRLDGREQHVLRFDVAVHDAHPVSRVERRAELGDDLGGSAGRQWAALLEQRPQVAARDERHDQVQGAVLGLAGIMDRHQVRVRKRRHPGDLAQESLPEALVGGQHRRQHLDHVGARQPGVVREVEDAHPASGELALDPPAGEDLARLQVQGVTHVGSVPYHPPG